MWYWELTNDQKQKFGTLTGWSIDSKTNIRTKSKASIYPDSQDGPSEDFANNVEAYYYDHEKQNKFDPELQEFFKELARGKK